MARMNVSEARKSLSRLLDAAERGEDVVVERRGVRFRLVLDERERDREASRPPPFEVSDDVLEGDWSWEADRDGQLHFRGEGG